MNVLIVGRDEFLLDGVKECLTINILNCKIVKSKILRSENVSAADIIIFSLNYNEILLCHDEMLYRKKNSVLIFLTTEHSSSNNELEMYFCVRDAYLLNSKINLVDFALLIVKAIEDMGKIKIQDDFEKKCASCSYRYLTDSQFLVAYAIGHGASNLNIAKSLDITMTTVLSHLDRIKKKFLLKNTKDIWCFVKNNHLAPQRPIKPKRINIRSDL